MPIKNPPKVIRDKTGAPHCEDGPAIVWQDGTEEWYQKGLRHRIGAPAVIRGNGVSEFWENGKRKRTR